jgi:hypothetical protein
MSDRTNAAAESPGSGPMISNDFSVEIGAARPASSATPPSDVQDGGPESRPSGRYVPLHGEQSGVRVTDEAALILLSDPDTWVTERT